MSAAAGIPEAWTLLPDPGAGAAWVAGSLDRQAGPVLLLGPPGTGKSRLAAMAAARAQVPAACLSADPGSPAFGVPGALALADRSPGGGWELRRLAALCTLDAARFRLPLVEAVRRLLDGLDPRHLIVDAPGAVRGVAGAELLLALAGACRPGGLLLLCRDPRYPPLRAELEALGLPTALCRAATAARRPGKPTRERNRTRLWDAWLAGTPVWRAPPDLPCIGTPPPRGLAGAWGGRQVALLDRQGNTLALGEVVRAEADGTLEIRGPRATGPGEVLLVRDATRDTDGLLRTAPRAGQPQAAPWAMPPEGAGPAAVAWPSLKVGPFTATLVNGVFGDPLVLARMRYRGRVLLFDLGDARLPTRTVHHVTDLCLSHLHLDHIGGFFSLLRNRMGLSGVLRIYGPAGTARRIQALLEGICWDRIGERGPRFRVREYHHGRCRDWELRAGGAATGPTAGRPCPEGVVHEEAAFSIRAAELDHAGTPVLAYALVPPVELHVRKERLRERGLEPGPWLGELKERLAAGEGDAPVVLPDGTRATAAELGRELILTAEPEVLAYASDLADTPDNRRRLTALARGAHTLFCEAPFAERDRDQAVRTGHLTTVACAGIAAAAGVGRLVPFHFSRRYADHPEVLIEEIASVSDRAILPPAGRGEE